METNAGNSSSLPTQRAKLTRAEASRRNGARSLGPVTPEGKARSVRNRSTHGLNSRQFLRTPEESTSSANIST